MNNLVREGSQQAKKKAKCRFCLGNINSKRSLLRPCRCTGSMKYVHKECLNAWRHTNPYNMKQCNICKTPYIFASNNISYEYISNLIKFNHSDHGTYLSLINTKNTCDDNCLYINLSGDNLFY